MTALNSAILFNNSTGSDTQSSGSSAGANVYGSGASTTSASAVVTGITTTGVQAGDLLWVQSSSGRQFSVIASVDSGTQVTCDDTFANTESSRTWAIGGKRATFDNADSRELFTNFHVAVLDKIKTETDQTLTSTIAISRSYGNPLVIYADDQKTISTTGDFSCFSVGQYQYGSFYNLKFVCGTTSTTAAIQAGTVNVSHCQFGEDGSANNWKYGIHGSSYAHECMSHRCKFYGKGETVFGFAHGGTHYNSGGHWMTKCFAKDYEVGYYGYPRSTICNGNIFYACKHGVKAYQNMSECAGNIFHDISSSCIIFESSSANTFQQQLSGLGSNIFSDVSGHLIDSSQTAFGDAAANKNLYTYPSLPTLYAYNSSNTFNNMPTFPVQTLSASLFVDAANGDFNLNADAGGGATLRANNFSINTDTAVYPFRQYVSDAFGAGGGGSQFHPLG